MILGTFTILFLQAEVVGDAIGKGVLQALGILLLIVAGIGGFILFLWLVRKIDKKVNK